ncbi:MAG: DNA-binding response regulator [Pedosphaera sp.]|jgi:DNA-binding NarL/FixJ family response regulator|nr:DNA-binding response regulator [Pedosphaera sp.]
MPITISIVEDNPGTRQTLVDLLTGDTGLRCLGTYPTAEAAILGIPSQVPDVALVDINLPGKSGIECVTILKRQMPKLRVLMLTTYEESDQIFSSLRAGASGYLLKDTSPAELIQAIEQVHAGGAPMSMQIARKVVDHFHHIQQPASDVETLTKREKEILVLLAKGYYYKEIADQLGITLNTVRTHVHTIYEKLHVQSRTEATAKYLSRTQPEQFG